MTLMKAILSSLAVFLALALTACIHAQDAAGPADVAKDAPPVAPKNWPTTRLPISPIADMTLVGKAATDPDYYLWCVSPIQAEDGKVHLFCSRWPKTPQKMKPWYTHSEIVHYVGDGPEGPFKLADVAIPCHPGAPWHNSIHNPAISKVGDTYVLLYITFDNRPEEKFKGKMVTCMATSKSLNGPWQRQGKDGMIVEPSPDPKHWTHIAQRGLDNPTFIAHGGKFYLYAKIQPSRAGQQAQRTPAAGGGEYRLTHYACAVADKLEGPYILGDDICTENINYIEDATAFVWDGKFNLLVTDNFGTHTGIPGTGVLWQSDTPTHFKLADAKVGFLLPQDCWNQPIDRKKMGHPAGFFKFNRPGILMQNGKPAYFYATPGDSPEGEDRTSSYVFKINLPQSRNSHPLRYPRNFASRRHCPSKTCSTKPSAASACSTASSHAGTGSSNARPGAPAGRCGVIGTELFWGGMKAPDFPDPRRLTAATPHPCAAIPA